MKLKLLQALSIVAFATMSTSAFAQVSDDVVRIGVSDDMSGAFADSGGPGSVTAAKMAIEDFGGKVLGKPIEVLVADHQNKADVGTAIARTWLDVNKVDMITGLGNSAVAIATQGLAQQKSALTIVTGAGSSDLTGKYCSPTGFHWVYDTYALANVIAKSSVKRGHKEWFFVTADYSFGQTLERDATKFLQAEGGRVAGSVKFPVGSTDFASFLMQAQSSKANSVAFAAAGSDFVTLVKQADEFGLSASGKESVGLLVYLSDIKSIGLKTGQGLILSEAFYWDLNDQTRAFAKRFYDRAKRMPTMVQACTYSAVDHYLKAIRAAGTDNAQAVATKMRELPINDFMTKNGKARIDGRVVRDMYLFQVKTPAESHGEWDFYKQLAVISGDAAFRPLAEGGCPLVK